MSTSLASIKSSTSGCLTSTIAIAAALRCPPDSIVVASPSNDLIKLTNPELLPPFPLITVPFGLNGEKFIPTPPPEAQSMRASRFASPIERIESLKETT